MCASGRPFPVTRPEMLPDPLAAATVVGDRPVVPPNWSVGQAIAGLSVSRPPARTVTTAGLPGQATLSGGLLPRRPAQFATVST